MIIVKVIKIVVLWNGSGRNFVEWKWWRGGETGWGRGKEAVEGVTLITYVLNGSTNRVNRNKFILLIPNCI